MKQSNIAAYAYAAGIVDGEGSFVVSWRQREGKDGYSRLSYDDKISVSQKDGRIIDWLWGKFGGFITIQKGYSEKQCVMYQWVIVHQQAYEFAKKIYPFLRYKKDQCEVYMRLVQRKQISKEKNLNGTFAKTNEGEKDLRQSLVNKLKELKHVWQKSAVLETKRTNSFRTFREMRSDSPSYKE